MEIDIDQVLQDVKPWDFTVRTGGVAYRTRRFAVGELGALVDGKLPMDRLAGLARSLFEGTPPDVERWDVERLVAFITAYTEYFQLHASHSKKADVVAAAAKAAVAEAATPGS